MQVVGGLQPLLSQLFAPDAALCELAALITDGGAPRQGLHYDTPMAVRQRTVLHAALDTVIRCGIAVFLAGSKP